MQGGMDLGLTRKQTVYFFFLPIFPIHTLVEKSEASIEPGMWKYTFLNNIQQIKIG